MEFRKDMKVSDINKEGFKIRYSDLKKCVLKNELGERDDHCRRIFKELKIEHYGDE